MDSKPEPKKNPVREPVIIKELFSKDSFQVSKFYEVLFQTFPDMLAIR